MPTVFGVDQLKDDAQAFLAARDIAPEILIGEWNAETHYGKPRVVFGLGKGKIEDPTGDRYGASGWVRPDPASTDVARALLHRAKTFPVWVHSVAPAGTAPALIAQEARRATAALVDAVLKAIRRTRGGMVMGWTDEEPVNDSEKRGGFVYGTVTTFGVILAVPVWDDPTPVAQADAVEEDASLVIGGADVPDPPETSTSPES